MIRPSAATAATVNVMNQAQILAYNQQQQRMMVGGTDPNFNAEILGAKKFGPPGCNLFVFHIPSEWSHKDLYDVSRITATKWEEREDMPQ